MKRIQVVGRFYKGVRKHPPTAGYRPHLVVEGTTDYLGVMFTTLPEVPLGEQLSGLAMTIYDVDYSALVPEANFTIMEGPNAVGEGMVVSVSER